MAKQKPLKWKNLTPSNVLDVKVGTRLRNSEGEVFLVREVLGIDEETKMLRLKMTPLARPPDVFAWDGEKWGFA